MEQSKSTIGVAVIGATGYAGAELVRILAGHPAARLTCVTSRQHVGVAYADVYPAFSNVVNLRCLEYDPEILAEKADIVFMALPHRLPMQLVPRLLERGLRVIDLSADFRFSKVDVYNRTYQEHTCPQFLSEAVYGLSEIYAKQIRQARLVGNPGCYPTSILLPLIPIIRKGWIDLRTIVADSKSGVSGAGVKPSPTTHFCSVNESFKAYKVACHRHNPEITEILSQQAGTEVNLTFVPHLVPMTRGMESTIYADLISEVDLEHIIECLQEEYPQGFVRIRGTQPPDVLHVRGTNYCDIGVRIDKANRKLILMSVIDNLVKGAAGQAVQNMNLMLDLDPAAGLDNIPFPI